MSDDPIPAGDTLSIAGGTVAIERYDGPTGAPELHFAHANGFNARTYRSLLRPLARDWTITAGDLRGHGATTLRAEPDEMETWDIYGDDLIAVLEALGPRPRLLVGHSMGAVASLMAAARRPDLASGLLMLEPVTGDWPRRAWMALLRRLGLVDRALALVKMTVRRRATFPDKAAALKSYRGRGAFRTWPEEMVADYVEAGLTADGVGGWRLSCAPTWEAANYRLGARSLVAEVRTLRCPVTVMAGTENSTVSSTRLALWQRLRPELRVITLDGASHFLPMEHPGPVRAEIARFLAARSSAPERSAVPAPL